MSRISRSRSLNSQRVHTSYVQQMNRPEEIQAISPLSPIKKTANPSYHSSESRLLLYDLYYDSLKELRQDFKHFYQQEKKLKSALENWSHQEIDLLNPSIELLRNYNQTIQLLKDLDQQLGTTYAKQALHIQEKHQEQLQVWGIANQNEQLVLQPNIFLAQLKKSQEEGYQSLQELKKLITSQYKLLSYVHLVKDKEPYVTEPIHYKGLIIEEKT